MSLQARLRWRYVQHRPKEGTISKSELAAVVNSWQVVNQCKKMGTFTLAQLCSTLPLSLDQTQCILFDLQRWGCVELCDDLEAEYQLIELRPYDRFDPKDEHLLALAEPYIAGAVRLERFTVEALAQETRSTRLGTLAAVTLMLEWQMIIEAPDG